MEMGVAMSGELHEMSVTGDISHLRGLQLLATASDPLAERIHGLWIDSQERASKRPIHRIRHWLAERLYSLAGRVEPRRSPLPPAPRAGTVQVWPFGE